MNPSFGFMVAHKPAIIAESELHPDHLLSSMYNKHMHIERMIPSVQEKYNKAMEDNAWRTLVYQYEETKAQIVNKVKLLLPAIPRGMDQVRIGYRVFSRAVIARVSSFRKKPRVFVSCLRV